MPELNKKANFELNLPVVKSWVEKKTDGSENFFFKVIVTGVKEDRDGEVMDDAAIDDMMLQFKSGKLPLFPDHGKDENGVRLYSWKQIMGVWVDAEREGDNLVAVCRLNNAHPDAEMFKNFLKEGMPVGFSIGGRPLNVIEEEYD